jgi:prevent-host-death family protein
MLVNIHEAKTQFSKLIHQVLRGEEVIIAKSGHPIIRLIPYAQSEQVRHGGQLRGLIEIHEDFDAPLDKEILKQFYGDDE